MGELQRVLVVVNKWWEADAVLYALLSQECRSPALGVPSELAPQRPRPLAHPAVQARPRGVWTLKHTRVELWCISDLLEDLPDVPANQSSTERKAERLPAVIAAGPPPALVIAVGTAGSPLPGRLNGAVALGTQVFTHDAHPDDSNPDSRWHDGPFDTLLASSLSQATFNVWASALNAQWSDIAKRYWVPPLGAAASGTYHQVQPPAAWSDAAPGRLLADYHHIALGAVNVTDYAEYAWADTLAVQAYKQHGGQPAHAVSLETTHGLIRVQTEAPFLFVSGITDRVGHFDEDVAPRAYAQNAACAHNAGVVLGWLLPAIDERPC